MRFLGIHIQALVLERQVIYQLSHLASPKTRTFVSISYVKGVEHGQRTPQPSSFPIMCQWIGSFEKQNKRAIGSSLQNWHSTRTDTGNICAHAYVNTHIHTHHDQRYGNWNKTAQTSSSLQPPGSSGSRLSMTAGDTPLFSGPTVENA